MWSKSLWSPIWIFRQQSFDKIYMYYCKYLSDRWKLSEISCVKGYWNLKRIFSLVVWTEQGKINCTWNTLLTNNLNFDNLYNKIFLIILICLRQIQNRISCKNFEISFWWLQFFQKTNENNLTWGTIVVTFTKWKSFLSHCEIEENWFSYLVQWNCMDVTVTS